MPDETSRFRSRRRGDAQRALDRVFADCAADPFCRTSFPGCGASSTRCSAGSTAARCPVRVQHPRIRGQRNGPADARGLRRSAADHAVLDRPVTAHTHRDSPRARGRLDTVRHLRVRAESSRFRSDRCGCASQRHVRRRPERRARMRATRSSAITGAACTASVRACGRTRVTDRGRGPVTTQAPVLLITGALDPVTPPRFAESRRAPHT